MMATVEVQVVTETQPVKVSCSESFTAEDLCILLCQKYSIPPLTRTLFALRVKGTDFFLQDNCLVLASTRVYELRIRYKVPRLRHLITLDETTFDYYFQQARNDVNENRIPEIKYSEHKKQLLGLGITDMYRAVLEEKLTVKDVKKYSKRYIPKVILRRHGPFPKTHARKFLPQICASKKAPKDVNFVKSEYLQQVYELAPNYLSEEYRGVSLQQGTGTTPVTVQVAPFHAQQPGLRIYHVETQQWEHVSTIEDLVYLTRNKDLCLEVSRRGTPLFLKFQSEKQMSSFISVCDGYYRHMEKWTFNLSKDDETPSLKLLRSMKCHGPVGGAFSYRKLVEKREKKHGCYILRQCQDEYNVYFIDVCTQNNTVEIYTVKYNGHCYKFINDFEYPSIESLVASYKNPEGRIYLNECIPPTEYGAIDKSQLLLCSKEPKVGFRIDQAQLQELLRDNRSPRCLNTKHLSIFKGSEKVGSGSITVTKKAIWKLEDSQMSKSLIVAFKTLQNDKINDYLKEFVDLASKWVCVQSSSIVRLYGVTLSSPTAMVLEYIPHGPFDEYLRQNRDKLKPLHLKKVAVTLARALWDLSEAGVVHGYIRCRRLLLMFHDDEKIVVKLSGPSLNPYTADDIHWIPVEFFHNKNLARCSVEGDIWAFATTLWEIFSYGQSPAHTNPVNTVVSYRLGERLLSPAACVTERETFALLRRCWDGDPHQRPRPQELMRDLNHLLHAEYIPVQQDHDIIPEYDQKPYGQIVPETTFTSEDVGSNKSLITKTPSIKSTMSDRSHPGIVDSLQFEDENFLGSISGLEPQADAESVSSCDAGAGGGGGGGVDDYGNSNAPRLMECIFHKGMSYLVTFSKKIGTGNYGWVYAGWMERDNQQSTRTEVAIKKLRRARGDSASAHYEAFRNEMEIMKSLHHPNIVKILGYSWDHDSDVLIVMEYLEEGALSHYLKAQRNKLTIKDLLKYAHDIAMGMDHIAAKRMVHRDLAARNVLVVSRKHVKISDFGLARIIPKEQSDYRVNTEQYLPIDWYAPESATSPYMFTTKSDVWSFGVTVWEIFSRGAHDVPKFDKDKPLDRAHCFPIPEGCPPEIFQYLIKGCWSLEPSARPTFTELAGYCLRFLSEF